MPQDRRRFLSSLTAALAGCGNSAAPPPDLACAVPADGPGLPYCLVERKAIRIGGAGRLEVGQVLLMTLGDGTAALVARDERGFYALSATCTHACCTVTICAGDACAT